MPRSSAASSGVMSPVDITMTTPPWIPASSILPFPRSPQGWPVLVQAGQSPFDPKAPLPAALYDGRPPPTSGAQRLYEAAREHPGLPLRELARQLSKSSTQNQFAGTPEQLADHVIAWQDAGAVDGFTIMGSTLPRELTAFAEQVVPILQARGRFRTEYSGSTLRDHLGLDRPAGYRSEGGRA